MQNAVPALNYAVEIISDSALSEDRRHSRSKLKELLSVFFSVCVCGGGMAQLILPVVCFVLIICLFGLLV